MAYAALVSLAQTIDLFLNYHQDSIFPQLKNQIISIDKYVIFFQAFLEDFPDQAKSLEGRIRKATHVAEDIIEFFMWLQIHESCYPSTSKFKFQTKGQYEHRELKLVKKEIESIAEKVMEIKNSIIVKDVRPGDSTAASLSSRVAQIHQDAMVGFDNDLMDIISRLRRESLKREVVSIVGMGGIGKTTLARNAYDHPLIVKYFDICAWVTLSQDYSVRGIVSDLLVSMKGLDARNESMKEQKVYQSLKGRRYLIVLDDIWSTKAWDNLNMMFPDDGNGSRIMLTTRLLDVASYAGSSSRVQEMRLMDEDQSWTLLRQKVFKQDPCPDELEHLGKKIAQSCRGLPLAIVVISGILAVDQTEAAWWNIAKNVKSAISANDEQFDKILSLSYTHLPHHLRPCFLYIGGFPEYYELRVSKLIKLWVAEGFLKPNGCNQSLEETAEEYLEDLVKRSLVLVTKRKSNGQIKSFIIHDLMREMCIRKAHEENFILHVCGFLREGTKFPRRIISTLDFLENVYGSTVRTIIQWSPGLLDRDRDIDIGCSLEYFRLLRILDLSFADDGFHNFPPLPAKVFELYHLRYLAFYSSFPIPADISILRNLQTLITGLGNEVDVQLPEEIWQMPQLRHLIFFSPLLSFQDRAMFALENLQTLSTAINFVCSEKILKMIPNLKKLGISYRKWIIDGEEKYEEDYQLHNLIYLQQLENLKLKIYWSFPCPKKVKPAFPMTLKKLTLSHLGLPWKDMTIVGSLPNLKVLKLRDHACVGDKWETTEEEFSQLNFLLIDESHLEYWTTESSHFPRLKCIVLCDCRYLREIPAEVGEIPTLELIEVDNRNKSLVVSAKQIQDDQRSSGNDAFQVRCV